MITPQLARVISTWQEFLRAGSDWHILTQGIEPKQTDCGPVYELENPLPGHGGESFAVADMSGIKVAGPHYHHEETEIYYVLEGKGTVVVGGQEIKVQPGTVVYTPPETAHFTISQGLIVAVVNTPPMDPARKVPLTDSDPSVGFDKAQFDRLQQH